ncbi:hypothetical protein Sgou_06130 [Streptomyces gougerotii]|uniref:Uncharacterized protein n=1 Tax=Streptomyces gougerotii TaxID=53448 RepID=A0ABQ1D0C6_9ACTN|nr:hypothetical protein Sgou_06130 [Streptomyces gougerotii]
MRLSVVGGEGGGAADPDEGVPATSSGRLGGFQEEGAGRSAASFAVEADRGVTVHQELAADGDYPAVLGELAERVEVHARKDRGRRRAVTARSVSRTASGPADR